MVCVRVWVKVALPAGVTRPGKQLADWLPGVTTGAGATQNGGGGLEGGGLEGGGGALGGVTTGGGGALGGGGGGGGEPGGGGGAGGGGITTTGEEVGGVGLAGVKHKGLDGSAAHRAGGVVMAKPVAPA